MGRVCTVCAHPEVEAINQALVAGESQRAVAQRFGISHWSVGRHARGHLPAALLRAQEAEKALSADNLLAYVHDLRDWARRIAARAEAAGDLRAALLGIRECGRIVGLVLKWRGLLRDDGQDGLVQIYLPAVEGLDVKALSDSQLDAVIRRGRRGGQGVVTPALQSDDNPDNSLIASLQERLQRAEYSQRVAEAAARQAEERMTKKLAEAERARAWAQERADRLDRELKRTSVMYVT